MLSNQQEDTDKYGKEGEMSLIGSGDYSQERSFVLLRTVSERKSFSPLFLQVLTY